MTGRAHLQEAIRDALSADLCLTLADLADLVPGYERRHLSSAICRLIRRDLVERREVGCYCLTAAGQKSKEAAEAIPSGPYKPLTNKNRRPKEAGLRQRVWRTMPVLQKFTIAELIAPVVTGDEKQAHTNIRRYLRDLSRAGYLRELRRQPGDALTSNGFKRYQLIRHTGPLAPVTKRGGIYDRNWGVIYDFAN